MSSFEELLEGLRKQRDTGEIYKAAFHHDLEWLAMALSLQLELTMMECARLERRVQLLEAGERR